MVMITVRGLILPMVLLFSITLALSDDVEGKRKTFAFAGYLPEYRFYINVNLTAALLSDLILFSVQPNADGTISDCCLSNDHYSIAHQAAAFKRGSFSKDLHLWLSIGGAGRSLGFLTAMKNSPKKLAHEIAKKAKGHRMYGVDLDCEQIASQEDYQVYVNWIQKYGSPVLRKSGIRVSVALHAGMILPSSVYDLVDRIHLMAYDLLRPETPFTSHADKSKVEPAVQQFLKSGCPSHKLILGIPAYARHKSQPHLVRTFAETVDAVSPKDGPLNHDKLMTLEWDGYVLGDSLRTVSEKVAYARELRLGGVFMWELGQDKQIRDSAPSGLLLTAMVESSITDIQKPKDEL